MEDRKMPSLALLFLLQFVNNEQARNYPRNASKEKENGKDNLSQMLINWAP